MIGLGGMAVCSIIMTVSLLLKDEGDALSFICITAVLIYVAFFETGQGPIPCFIVSELFRQGPCPAAMAEASCSNSTSNFLAGLLFPSVAAYLGAYVFHAFTTFLIKFLIFTFLKLTSPVYLVEMSSIQPVKDSITNVLSAFLPPPSQHGKQPHPEYVERLHQDEPRTASEGCYLILIPHRPEHPDKPSAGLVRSSLLFKYFLFQTFFPVKERSSEPTFISGGIDCLAYDNFVSSFSHRF
uniref:Major facilitator superfamily (MFS) profile domain-containing protein n=1 Tax=Marmota marmota marmota TaxID=9994 RepID=A0A8C5Z369_MARMA